ASFSRRDRRHGGSYRGGGDQGPGTAVHSQAPEIVELPMRLPALSRILLPLGAAMILAACAREGAPTDKAAATPDPAAHAASEPIHDQHSYSEPDKVRIKDIALDLAVDFEAKQIAGTA